MDITRRSVARALILSIGCLLLVPAEAQRAGCFPTYTPRPGAPRPVVWAPTAFDGTFTIAYGRLPFDIDGDGAAELITDDAYLGLYSVIAYEPESHSYRIRTSRPQLLSNTFSMSPSFVGTLDGSGRPKLLSGGGGSLNVIDVRTGKIEITTQLAALVDGAHVLDVDRDGQVDIVGSGPTLMNTDLTRIKVFSRQLGLSTFVAGNFDADPNIELAGKSGLIYEYANGAFRLEKDFATSSVYPVYVAATDTNGDGSQELVYVCDGFFVRATCSRTQRSGRRVRPQPSAITRCRRCMSPTSTMTEWATF